MNKPVPSNAVLSLQSAKESSIGRVLLDMGKIKVEDAERIIRVQKENGLRFGEAAKQLGLINDEDIQHALAHQFDYPYLKPSQHNFSSELVAAYKPFSPQVEVLRAIRSQLMLRWFSGKHKSLAITSVSPDEGVSLFVANLAVVFSQLGEHTLLVDANLRKSKQHEIFNIKGNTGLSDVLVGRAQLSCISKVDSFIDLSVLPAGTIPPNPQELLGKSAFSQLNENLEQSFDVVLYDVPAFDYGADALSVIARTGGVLLVVRQGHTSLTKLSSLSEQIMSAGGEVVGSVLVDF